MQLNHIPDLKNQLATSTIAYLNAIKVKLR